NLFNSCATGGPMSLLMDDVRDIGYYVDDWWNFTAPPDTEIDNFTLQRAVSTSGDREFHLYRVFSLGSVWPIPQTDAENCISWFGSCPRLGVLNPAPFDPRNTLSLSGLDGPLRLSATFDCQPRSGQICPVAPYPDNGNLQIWSSRIGLKDTFAPTF